MGCVAIDQHYSVEIRRPTSDVSFVVIQWQTDWYETPNWESNVIEMARSAARLELKRQGLPFDTIYVGNPTKYGGTWVVVRVTAGSLPEDQLRAKASAILDAVAPGERLPRPIYRGKGEFPK
jgi:hypothetical protein